LAGHFAKPTKIKILRTIREWNEEDRGSGWENVTVTVAGRGERDGGCLEWRSNDQVGEAAGFIWGWMRCDIREMMTDPARMTCVAVVNFS